MLTNSDIEYLKAMNDSIVNKIIYYYETTEQNYRLEPCNEKDSPFYLPNGQTWKEHAEHFQKINMAAIDVLDGNQEEDDEFFAEFCQSELGRKLGEHLDHNYDIIRE